MRRCQNPYANNQNFMMNCNCTCGNQPFNQQPFAAAPVNQTFVEQCPPVVTTSTQVVNQYHVVKQPYVHNYHTEVVHHHVVQKEFIPNYTTSEVHVNEPENFNLPFNNTSCQCQCK